MPPREGKQSGAFCMGVPGRQESRVLLNFGHTLDDVFTIAHELGHAYHKEQYYRAGRTTKQRKTPILLAETASIFCETIIVNAMLAEASDEKKLAILEQDLLGTTQLVVDIHSRFILEHTVFEMRQERELSISELKTIMLDAQAATYGEGLDPDARHPLIWAHEGHYYDSKRSFYNYPYTFGYLFGLGLYKVYQDEPEGFRERYNNLLSSTGLDDAPTLPRRFGIDIEVTDFWRGSLDLVRGRVEQFEALVDSIMSYKDLFDLSGKRALVIGSGSGIGAAAAEGLADFGASVVCADVRLEAAKETRGKIGGNAEAAQIDITDEQSVQEVVVNMDALDILICTPSVNVRKPLLDYTSEEFDKVVTLNLKGSFFAMQAAGKRMAAQESGSIVLFSSIRSQVVEPGQGVYAATKAGTLQMVRALAAELGSKNVRVNAIAPGVVETPLTEQIKSQPEWYDAYAQKSALGRWAQPREMVGAVVYLASNAASFVTGTLTLVDGGWTAVDGRFTPPL